MATVEQLLFTLTLIAALGCGLVAGIFFAFSAFVMKALARLRPAEGITAMQSINVTVLNPWFLGAFFGTAAACVLTSIFSVPRWPGLGAALSLFGSALYLVGTLLVTMLFNVPRNEALASLKPADPDSVSRWARYVASWTAWNHVRTAAALVAAASFSVALGI